MDFLTGMLPQILAYIAGTGVVVWGIKWLFGKIKEWTGGKFNQIVDIIEKAVTEISAELAVKLKEAAADGKITEMEAAQLKEFAKQRAIHYAKEQGLDLLKLVGVQVLDQIIEKAVLKNKADVPK